MDWDDIKVFLAVARAGSLGGAARALGQSQPTMGRRLKAFEDRLATPLFQRGGREGFLLTDAGAEVLAHAERMEEEALGFERSLAGQGDEPEGLIRVSSSDWFGLHVLAPVLAGFRQRHPKVCIELVTESRLFSLARREADLVFRIRPFDGAEVVQRRLMTLDYALYGAPGQPSPSWGDGSGLDLVTMDTAFAEMPDVHWLQRVLPRARVAMRSNNREVQAALCAAGCGWTVLPRLLGDGHAGLVRVDFDADPPPSREVYVGYHRDLRRLGRLQRLLTHVVAALAPVTMPASPTS
ncbi:MAG: LysR family transcriptional regulator [Burkholderiales bacterium]|nr:LysR family transcriptional regulator [Burkholderiales bacterium]